MYYFICFNHITSYLDPSSRLDPQYTNVTDRTNRQTDSQTDRATVRYHGANRFANGRPVSTTGQYTAVFSKPTVGLHIIPSILIP